MKKSTKKIVMILFIAFMTAVIAACGNDSANEKDAILKQVKKD